MAGKIIIARQRGEIRESSDTLTSARETDGERVHALRDQDKFLY